MSQSNVSPFTPEKAKAAAKMSAAVRRERAAARAAERERQAEQKKLATVQLRQLAQLILTATESE